MVYWQKRLRDDCAASVSLVPVRVSTQPTPAQDCRIHLPNGIVLECVGVLSAVDLADQLMQLGQG